MGGAVLNLSDFILKLGTALKLLKKLSLENTNILAG